MLSVPSVAIPVPVTARFEIRLSRFSPRCPETQIVDSNLKARFQMYSFTHRHTLGARRALIESFRRSIVDVRIRTGVQ